MPARPMTPFGASVTSDEDHNIDNTGPTSPCQHWKAERPALTH